MTRKEPADLGQIGGLAIPIPNALTSRQPGLRFSDIRHKKIASCAAEENRAQPTIDYARDVRP
jgi:hypothetical protein